MIATSELSKQSVSITRTTAFMMDSEYDATQDFISVVKGILEN